MKVKIEMDIGDYVYYNCDGTPAEGIVVEKGPDEKLIVKRKVRLPLTELIHFDLIESADVVMVSTEKSERG